MNDEIVAKQNKYVRNTVQYQNTNKPIVTVNPLEKYPLVDDARMHNEYTPAAAPVSTTLSVTELDDKNTELTLVTALTGLAQEAEDTTNADASPLTFTSPAPTTEIA